MARNLENSRTGACHNFLAYEGELLIELSGFGLSSEGKWTSRQVNGRFTSPNLALEITFGIKFFCI